MAKEQSIGALWIEPTRGGGEFMKGTITIEGRTHRITVFRNSYRTDTNRQPHYRILPSTAPQDRQDAPREAAPSAPEYRPAPPAPLPEMQLRADELEGELTADDIPF